MTRKSIWYHGSDVCLTKLTRGSWVTNRKSVAKTFGKFVYIVDIEDDSINFDIIYSAVENTNEWRGTILKEALVTLKEKSEEQGKGR